MSATNYRMWPYWCDKYYTKAAALKDYYPEVLEAEPLLRLELIRIEAYEALIDKLINALEEGQSDTDDSSFPMWRIHREEYGYVEALKRHYAGELKKNEALRVALQNIQDAESAIDKWMTERADSEGDEE